MLVLSRRENESVVIGGSVEVSVVEIRGDKVRLGITAPRSIDVWRNEIWLELEAERAATIAAEAG